MEFRVLLLKNGNAKQVGFGAMLHDAPAFSPYQGRFKNEIGMQK